MSSKSHSESAEKYELDINNCQVIANNLIEIKNLIIGKKTIKNNKANILEYCVIPEQIPFDEIKAKLNKIFNANNTDEIFLFLIDILIKLYRKEKQKGNNNSNNSDKQKLNALIYKIFENLNFFICYSIIYNNNVGIMNKATDFFINNIEKEINKPLIYFYVNVFNIKNYLYDYYGINRKKLMSIGDYHKVLNLINILRMQNIFTYEYIIKEKNNNFLCDNIFIYELYSTYNSSISEIKNLSKYILSLRQNFIIPSVIKQILDDKEINIKIDNEIIQILIEQLMINHSYIDKKSKTKFEKEIISFYEIITNYSDSNNIIKNLIRNNKEILEDFFYFRNIKDNDKNERFLSFINSIKNVNIVNEYVSDELLIELTKDLNMDKIVKYSNVIKGRKKVVDNILNNVIDKKEGIKIIKLFDLHKGEYDISFDTFSLNNYLTYKINKNNDNFQILLDYGLIDEFIFNALMNRLMKTIPKEYYEKEDKDIKLKEEEDEPNKKNKKNSLKNESDFKLKSKYFLEKSIHLEKQKILCLYHYGTLKNYNLTQRNQNSFSNIFGKNILNINYTFDLFFPEEKYEPIDSTCLKINLKKTKILFIESAKDYINNFNKYFKKSSYIGVDSEWREPIYCNEKIYPSILQMANQNESCAMIVDLKKLGNDEGFLEVFKNSVKSKNFIGYDFNTSDIGNFSESLQMVFNEINIIDIIDIYQEKYLKKAESLSKLCSNFFGKKLCKGCQCSQWDIRPLTKFQLHYAALDALSCIKIYNKIIYE